MSLTEMLLNLFLDIGYPTSNSFPRCILNSHFVPMIKKNRNFSKTHSTPLPYPKNILILMNSPSTPLPGDHMFMVPNELLLVIYPINIILTKTNK